MVSFSLAPVGAGNHMIEINLSKRDIKILTLLQPGNRTLKDGKASEETQSLIARGYVRTAELRIGPLGIYSGDIGVYLTEAGKMCLAVLQTPPVPVQAFELTQKWKKLRDEGDQEWATPVRGYKGRARSKWYQADRVANQIATLLTTTTDIPNDTQKIL